MTDKQIIIDGVDVSGCENFRPDADISEISYTNACSIGLWQRWYSNLEPSCIMSCSCKDNPNCHYKNWQRKEQECERLKSVRDSWISKCEQETKIKELYQDGLDQLKAENEELKKEREKKRDHYFMISNENARLEDEKSRLGYALNCKIEKLKQTLTEIKELIQKEIDDCEHWDDCTSCEYNCCLRQAMQICDEVYDG